MPMKKHFYYIPYLGFHTRAYTFGDIKNGTPLIILHGGPGGCVERYEVLEQLADQGIPLIFYDQLGAGYSRVPKGNEDLWTFETYLKELENVIRFFGLKKFSILGHSWGGMLALEWVCKYPHEGLEKLILFSTLPSTKIWNDEHLKIIESYPKEQVEAILNEKDKKPYDKKLFKQGMKRFYDEHVGKKNQRKYTPKTKHFPKTNKEIYNKMWGFSELFGNGTLADYDVTNLLYRIDVPTLILSGKYDESTPEMNRVMKEKIPHAKWVLLENSHHGGYNEEPDVVLESISKFIK